MVNYLRLVSPNGLVLYHFVGLVQCLGHDRISKKKMISELIHLVSKYPLSSYYEASIGLGTGKTRTKKPRASQPPVNGCLIQWLKLDNLWGPRPSWGWKWFHQPGITWTFQRLLCFLPDEPSVGDGSQPAVVYLMSQTLVAKGYI